MLHEPRTLEMANREGRGYAAVALTFPKFDVNVATVMRVAYNYRVALLVVSGRRYHRRKADTTAAYKRIPFIQAHENDVFNHIPFECVPIAVEIASGAIDLPSFCHPERAFYVFGPEDGTIPDAVRERCKSTVFIPTRECMNLANTVSVVLYDRMLKGLWGEAYCAARTENA